MLGRDNEEEIFDENLNPVYDDYLKDDYNNEDGFNIENGDYQELSYMLDYEKYFEQQIFDVKETNFQREGNKFSTRGA